MRVILNPTIEVIRKEDGDILLRSAEPTDGHKPTGKAKNRFDRTLTGPAAVALAAVLDSPDRLIAAVTDGYVTLDVPGGNGQGRPAFTGPSIADLMAAAAAAAAEAPQTARKGRKATV